MKHILLLATGGTIASVESEGGLAPGLSAEDLIRYTDECSQDVQIYSKTLMSIDSTNMQPEHWVKIAQAIAAEYDQYDGFIITHGTDTLAYTSAALSYMLQHAGKPIVVTGSQVPISYKKTDARKNLGDAIRFACENIGGVFVVFDGRVIMGTRAVKMRTKSYDAFESINYPYVAYIKGNDVHYQTRPTMPTEAFKLDASLCPDVFLLKLYPGTQPELFDCLTQFCKGVVIESFGNGGLPFHGRNLLPKIEDLVKRGISVVITTQCLEEGENLEQYEVGRRVAKLQVILSGDMNTEAIVAKLMWALGKTGDQAQVKQIIETPMARDLTPSTEKESW